MVDGQTLVATEEVSECNVQVPLRLERFYSGNNWSRILRASVCARSAQSSTSTHTLTLISQPRPPITHSGKAAACTLAKVTALAAGNTPVAGSRHVLGYCLKRDGESRCFSRRRLDVLQLPLRQVDHLLVRRNEEGQAVPDTTDESVRLMSAFTHSSFSSRSAGIAISCAGVRRLLADSSSVETLTRFRQASKLGSVMNTLRAPSSRITGWLTTAFRNLWRPFLRMLVLPSRLLVGVPSLLKEGCVG